MCSGKPGGNERQRNGRTSSLSRMSPQKEQQPSKKWNTDGVGAGKLGDGQMNVRRSSRERKPDRKYTPFCSFYEERFQARNEGGSKENSATTTTRVSDDDCFIDDTCDSLRNTPNQYLRENKTVKKTTEDYEKLAAALPQPGVTQRALQCEVFDPPVEDTVHWSPIEKCLFLDDFLQHPKDFFAIAKCLRHKTTKDCIAFYYASKKTVPYKAVVAEFDKRQKSWGECHAWDATVHAAIGVGAVVHISENKKQPPVFLFPHAGDDRRGMSYYASDAVDHTKQELFALGRRSKRAAKTKIVKQPRTPVQNRADSTFIPETVNSTAAANTATSRILMESEIGQVGEDDITSRLIDSHDDTVTENYTDIVTECNSRTETPPFVEEAKVLLPEDLITNTAGLATPTHCTTKSRESNQITVERASTSTSKGEDPAAAFVSVDTSSIAIPPAFATPLKDEEKQGFDAAAQSGNGSDDGDSITSMVSSIAKSEDDSEKNTSRQLHANQKKATPTPSKTDTTSSMIETLKIADVKAMIISEPKNRLSEPEALDPVDPPRLRCRDKLAKKEPPTFHYKEVQSSCFSGSNSEEVKSVTPARKGEQSNLSETIRVGTQPFTSDEKVNRRLDYTSKTYKCNNLISDNLSRFYIRIDI